MKSFLALCFILLFLPGCGKQWEKFWGQDMENDVVYITDKGFAVESPINGQDMIRVLVPGLSKAQFVNCKLVDSTGVFIEIPVFTNNVNVLALQDRDMVTFVNLNALPNAVRVRVEYIAER